MIQKDILSQLLKAPAILKERILMAELLDQEPELRTPLGFLTFVYLVMCVIIKQRVLPLSSSTCLFNCSDQTVLGFVNSYAALESVSFVQENLPRQCY